jgi:hypothetical protein
MYTSVVVLRFLCLFVFFSREIQCWKLDMVFNSNPKCISFIESSEDT